MNRLRWLLLCASVVMLMLAGCTQTEEGQEKTPPRFEAKSGDTQGVLTISPGIVGINTYSAVVTDKSNQKLTTGKAILHFAMPNMDHGKSDLELTPQPDGTWTGEGPHLMMEGDWQITLEWQDEQGNSQTYTYTYNLKE
ncbi:FixH family protein [Brevibacillus dissolubilis]|uniref:FixH family protein n=1 Tax=Brevibacillus dissolubilis TaxID=1844116 RepID=UPI00159B8BBE|nr:FixH family protein [Brevibacillus dissolubilis]